MMKFSPHQKRLGLSLILLLAALAAAAGVTYAIYTSQVYQRAVVRNRDTEDIRFSSDKLYRVVSDDTTAKKYYCPMSQGQKTMSFTVCNYDQSKKTVVNQHRLEYDIKIQVNNGTDGFEYTINDSTVYNGQTWTQSGALAGGRRSMDTYTIKFSEDDYNRVEVTVTVTPKDPSLTKNTKLYGTLIPIEYATTQGVKLSSEFSDSANAEIKDVDAYNYSVSISGGEDDVVIAWDHSQLDIDPFFLGKMKKPDGSNYVTNGNISTLTIHMNSEDETASYHFQFYNHGTQKPTSWDALNVSVTRKSAE